MSAPLPSRTPTSRPHRTLPETLFAFLMRHRLAVALVLAAITLALGSFAARVEFDNTIESYFLASDLRDYDRFLDEFGSDELIVLGFGGEDVFTVESFARIDALTDKLSELPHVRRVLSLTTAKVVSGSDESVDFDRLTPALPTTPLELAQIRRRALADPILPGTLVSPDGRHTVIVAEIDHLIGQFDYKVDLLQRVRALVGKSSGQTAPLFHLGGTPVLDDAVFRDTQRDQMLFFPVMIAIILVVMVAMFRHVVAGLLPFVVVGVSAIWAYGFMAWMGYKINVISTILGPLLLAVGIADSMHILAHTFERATQPGADRNRSIEQAFCDLLAPCTMTSLTTVLGLLSLLSADLVPIREFGLVAAAGVVSALLVTILLLPILLSLLPLPEPRDPTRSRAGSLTRLLGWLGTWKRRRALLVLALCALGIAPAIVSLSHLTVGTNTLDYFRRDDPVRLETEWIDAHVAGTASLEFLVDAGVEDSVLDPDLLERMDRLQTYLTHVPGITSVLSVTTLLKTLHRAFHGGDASYYRIPGSPSEVAQELLIVEGSKDLEELLSPDRARARITARVAMEHSRELAHRMPEIEAQVQAIFGNKARVTPTGLVYLMNRMERYLLSSQTKSFLLAFAVITVVMIAALRSWRLGLLAMIPNLLPILFVLALMPLLGIALDVGTVMIAGVALGLVVDDTTHLLYRIRARSHGAITMREAIAPALRGCGRPVVYTSLVLSLGFSVLVLASFNPVIHFGVLASAVVLFALICDLLVLPAALGFLRGTP